MRDFYWNELPVKHDSTGRPFIDALPEGMKEELGPDDDGAWIMAGINESLAWCHEHMK